MWFATPKSFLQSSMQTILKGWDLILSITSPFQLRTLVAVLGLKGLSHCTAAYYWLSTASFPVCASYSTYLCSTFVLPGQDYPCGGKLVALGGLDGAELWHCQTRSTVLDTACGDLDVDGDGRTDCIVTGRHATLQAVDLKKGQLWIWK